MKIEIKIIRKDDIIYYYYSEKSIIDKNILNYVSEKLGYLITNDYILFGNYYYDIDNKNFVVYEEDIIKYCNKLEKKKYIKVDNYVHNNIESIFDKIIDFFEDADHGDSVILSKSDNLKENTDIFEIVELTEKELEDMENHLWILSDDILK